MFRDEFYNHISSFTSSPLLFIGSGFSQRYLGLPTWKMLLKDLCIMLELPRPYGYYNSNANENLPKTASLMGEDFNGIWWSQEKYADSRNKFQEKAKSNISPLKFEICNKFSESKPLESPNLLNELRLLRKVNIDGIITTNWDEFAESLFPDFKRYIGQEELIFSDLYNIGEIYKIHGCISKPDSLILSDEDYLEYNERNSYLAAKLLTLFIENPIIFIGYSLDDKNIQEILKSVVKCLTKENINKLNDRLIFCDWQNEETITSITNSTILITDTPIPIKLIKLSNFIDLYTVLADNKKKFPVKVLRQMKGMIYDFVKSNKSKQKIYVTDNLDNIEDINKAEFVYGLGLKDKLAQQGIKGIELKDLLKNLILENEAWNYSMISRLALPSITGKYIPYFKYLRKAEILNNIGSIDEDSDIIEFSPQFIRTVNNITIQSFYPSESYSKKRNEINSKYDSFKKLCKGVEYKDLHIMMYTPLLNPEKIDLNDLHQYLSDNIHILEDSKNGTHFRKLICLYDFLMYKNN